MFCSKSSSIKIGFCSKQLKALSSLSASPDETFSVSSSGMPLLIFSSNANVNPFSLPVTTSSCDANLTPRKSCLIFAGGPDL